MSGMLEHPEIEKAARTYAREIACAYSIEVWREGQPWTEPPGRRAMFWSTTMLSTMPSYFVGESE